jgi:predicted RNase H-like nuclease (RuvC/YqgF family)
MKTLIEAVEAWIDERVFANSWTADHEPKFEELKKRAHANETIAVRDADRISKLERAVSVLAMPSSEADAKFDEYERKLSVLHERVGELDRRLQLYLDSPSPESNGEESTVTELSMRLDDIDSKLDDLECSVEEKVDSCDVDDRVESAIEDIDFPDSYAIEVMIDDAIETKVMDAVIAEISATDFKITVER